jgi:kinesin family protein 13
MSVKVGVRVRPFNQRESDLNCKLCVKMMGPTTRLFDAEDPEDHKKYKEFTFDYSFWSHDQFEVR